MTPNVHLIERDTNDPGGRILGTGSSNHGLESHIELTNGSLSSHYFESPLMSDYPDNVLVDEPTFESWMPNMDASIGIDLELLEPIADSVLDIGHSPTDSYTANSSCEFNMDLDESIATQYLKHDNYSALGRLADFLPLQVTQLDVLKLISLGLQPCGNV